MGMDFKQALEFLRLTRSLSEPAVPITGSGRDLWNYSKIVGSTLKKDIIHRVLGRSKIETILRMRIR